MSNMDKPLGGHDKNDFIQVWRGIAAFLVIYYHLSNRVPLPYLGMEEGPSIIFYSGKIGVLIFFIISGYLIVQSLQFSKNLASFYAKRISRIWPLFILASILIFVFLQFFDPPIVPDGPKKFYTEERSIVDLVGSLFFLENFGFQWIDGVFWSILVELKFYFYIGLLAALSPRNFVRYFAFLAVIISAAEMAISFSLEAMPGLRPVQMLLNGIFIAQYLPFFAIGALLVSRRDTGLLMAVVALALVQSSMKTMSNPDLHAGNTAIFLALLATIVILDAMLLRSRIFLFLGDYSYSWYLFHQMIGLAIIKAVSSHLNYDQALILALLVTLAISVLASWAAEWRFREPVYKLLRELFSKFGLDRLDVNERGRRESHAG